ncbi:MAG: M4 family metallopeptidase [Fidelibacterota bacterium]|nr:MAG: M4 family metallopeptidase [Candidatus Neomarinimicrobiota bacterium]
MRNLQIVAIIIIVVLHVFAYGQGPNHEAARSIGLAPDFVAEKVADIIVTPHGSKWLVLRYDSQISPMDIFEEYRAEFKLGKDDRMDLYRTEEDNLGFTHYRFQQTYQGIKVEGAEMLVHARDGYAARTNGNIVTDLDVSIQPSISGEVALDSALNAFSAKTYMWESPEWEAELKERKNDSTATFYPKADLVLRRSASDTALNADHYRLAYKFTIHSLIPFDVQAVYVDAQTGEVFERLPLIHSAVGTVSTLYNSPPSRSIITEYRTPTDDYILVDDSRGDGIHTRELNTYTYKVSITGDEYTDTDNVWNAGGPQVGASAHWAAEMTYDMTAASPYGRDSYDGNGAEINVYANWPNRANARWDGVLEVLILGDGNAVWSDLVSLDVVGHEFSHGVDQYSADLEMINESGALDESFADIHGTMVEFYVEGASSGDYYIGEDFIPAGGRLRNMSDPHTENDPDTYGTNDPFWYTGPNQSVLVHTNSGVQNYWFYLLAEGGSGTNENNDSYSVIGIGKDKAAAIAYRNHIRYLWSSSEYADSREGAIWAASDLYGGVEVTQTLNAWYAVGVGPSIPDYITLQNETISDTVIYLANNRITAGPSVTIQSGAQVLFFAGDSVHLKPGFTASTGSKVHAIAAQGGGSPLGKVVAMAPAAQTIEGQPVADEEESIPSVYSLSHGYPNPFNPNITIPFGLPEPIRTRLVVYDLLGREVVRLVDEHLEPGYHAVVWNGRNAAGSDVPSGLYIARLVTPEYTKSIKMVLLK